MVGISGWAGVEGNLCASDVVGASKQYWLRRSRIGKAEIRGGGGGIRP